VSRGKARLYCYFVHAIPYREIPISIVTFLGERDGQRGVLG
jgi:hypothetical protein